MFLINLFCFGFLNHILPWFFYYTNCVIIFLCGGDLCIIFIIFMLRWGDKSLIIFNVIKSWFLHNRSLIFFNIINYSFSISFLSLSNLGTIKVDDILSADMVTLHLHKSDFSDVGYRCNLIFTQYFPFLSFLSFINRIGWGSTYMFTASTRQIFSLKTFLNVGFYFCFVLIGNWFAKCHIP